MMMGDPSIASVDGDDLFMISSANVVKTSEEKVKESQQQQREVMGLDERGACEFCTYHRPLQLCRL
jgi:hypothetical protein